MKIESEDRAKVPVAPPLYFLLCIGAALILEYLLPSHPFNIPWTARITTSGLLFLISGYLAIGAFIVLIQHKTPFDHARSTTVIVRAGPFRFSRNPMYLSLLILTAGIAVLTFSMWLFMAIAALFILLDRLAVKPEEKYLAYKFGKNYLSYKERVRRWI